MENIMKEKPVIKKTTPIQNLEVYIQHEDRVPRVVLNGIDFNTEDVGLVELNIKWKTAGPDYSHEDDFIEVEYLTSLGDGADDRAYTKRSTVKQSFPFR